jgi:hypothetical protein
MKSRSRLKLKLETAIASQMSETGIEIVTEKRTVKEIGIEIVTVIEIGTATATATVTVTGIETVVIVDIAIESVKDIEGHHTGIGGEIELGLLTLG